MSVPRLTEENRRWWVLATMTGSLSMILIDSTVVSVALPTMQRDLDLTTVGVQWVVNAYLLAIAVLVALGGRIGDLIGNTRTFRLGAVVFVVASALCGLAQSEAWIIAARALEGVGAALMTPATGAIVMNAFRPSERGRAMGYYAGISMVFLALGPLLGGVLTEGVSWRAVFYINLPLGVAMLVMARFTLRPAPPPGGRMDWGGTVLIVGALTCLVLGLMQSRSWGWGSPATIGLFVAAAVLFPLMIWWELRAREPLVQLRLFANRNFTADGVVLLTIQFALMGVAVFGAIWVQNVLGFTPIQSGLSLLPLTAPMIFVAPRVGALYDRIGPRLLVSSGAATIAIGLGWCAATLHHRAYAWLVPGYLVMSVGLGLTMSPANTDGMNAAPARLRGQASGVIQTMRQVGGTLGIAIIGTIVANIQLNRITDLLERSGAPSAEVHELEKTIGSSTGATSGGMPVPAEIADGVKEAMTTAVATAYGVSAGIVMASAVLAVLLLRRQRAADDAPDDVTVGEALG